MELSGRLAWFPIAELLTWAANDRRTGSLVLRRSSREKRIYLREGKVVACLSDATGEFYGKHLLLEGYLEEDTLLRCLLQCKDKGKRLGAVLVEEGILGLDVVQRTLSEQLEDLICDVFLWNRGIFFFVSDPPPEEEILARPINTLALVLEGSRWVDELKRIRKVVRHDNLSLRRVGRQSPRHKNARKSAILRELAGRMTVAQLYEAVGGSYFRFLYELCEMVQESVVEIRDRGRSGPTGTYELPLSQLLLEQAAEEQLSLALRDVAIPVHLLEPYYPVRAREPEEEDRQRMSEAERAFLDRFDGRRPLREILSPDRAERTSQVELLLVLVGKGLLAFIPPPVEELEA